MSIFKKFKNGLQEPVLYSHFPVEKALLTDVPYRARSNLTGLVAIAARLLARDFFNIKESANDYWYSSSPATIKDMCT
jgi:hypothetical protein